MLVAADDFIFYFSIIFFPCLSSLQFLFPKNKNAAHGEKVCISSLLQKKAMHCSVGKQKNKAMLTRTVLINRCFIFSYSCQEFSPQTPLPLRWLCYNCPWHSICAILHLSPPIQEIKERYPFCLLNIDVWFSHSPLSEEVFLQIFLFSTLWTVSWTVPSFHVIDSDWITKLQLQLFKLVKIL